MIERTIVNGRHAVVAYVDDNFDPVDKDKATMARVLFEDGEDTAWLIRDKSDG